MTVKFIFSKVKLANITISQRYVTGIKGKSFKVKVISSRSGVVCRSRNYQS
jgi:hypothetical protein